MADGSCEGRPRLALVSLGCRVNRSDVDAIASALGADFALAARGERADYVVVNTCTVTGDADSTARQAIRRAAREYPGARIVAAGCYAQVCPEALADLPGVAAVVGAHAHTAIPEMLRRLQRGEAPATALARAREGAPAWGPAPAEPVGHTRPFLKVQDGCDSRCAFCLIPTARGPARSLPFEEALAQLATLGERRAEVVLAGVRLGSYGRDLAPARSLSELVRSVAVQRLVHRIRLSSIEPLEFPHALLGSDVAEAICPHFHLPLQSGSNRVLATMRRPYRADDYRRAIERIAEASPRACIGADVMVGFPGETAEDHRESLRLVEALPLAYLHVFTFSPRPRTPAALLPNAVPGDMARERARELLAISERRWRAHLAVQAGRVLEVVVERVEEGLARGTAREYVAVRWPAETEKRGDLVAVRVTASDGTECRGVRAASPWITP